jgi:GTP cyclohydrolase I
MATREEAIEAVKTILTYIGEDPNRPGLVKTPERFIKAWEQDWGLGYNGQYIANQETSILNGQFDAESYDAMLCVRKIRFNSFCEHHLAIFSGSIDIAYIPCKGGKILGLSKLVRVVDLFSKRLQVQERLTTQIADFIQVHCQPLGVGVISKATHSCMCSRGVKQFETESIASALQGEFLNVPAVKDEFFRLVEMK